jgi:hypothetical protein
VLSKYPCFPCDAMVSDGDVNICVLLSQDSPLLVVQSQMVVFSWTSFIPKDLRYI